MRLHKCRRLLFSLVAWATVHTAALSGEPADGQDKAALAKQLANPVATLISVPFQLNYDRGFGDASRHDGNKWTLNIQPVIPFSLNEEWNLVSRTIMPIVRTDDYPLGSGVVGGVGDITQSFFLSPKEKTDGGWTWGVGPVVLIPTGTDVSADTWGAGPTAVALKQQDGLTYGALVNHIWNIGGDVDISQSFIQPFCIYTTPEAFSVGVTSESTYNWNGTDGNRWTVPVIVSASQVMVIGHQKLSVGGGVKYYVESPDGGPEGWAFRVFVTLLFPQ